MSISVVMPVYNEEETIEQIVRECLTEIVSRIDVSELIVVNDGSTDSTAEILGRLAKEFPLLRVVSLEQNSGHSKALRVGFSKAKSRLILHIDSDNKFLAEDFWKLYSHAEDNDIVLGCRVSRHDRLHRRIISSAARIINAAIFGLFIKDANSPFKLIRKNVLDDVLGDISENAFVISILILIAAKYKGYRIAEVPVNNLARMEGKSKLSSPFSLLRGCFLSFCDIVLLKRRLLSRKHR